jgi:hypothetical protein
MNFSFKLIKQKKTDRSIKVDLGVRKEEKSVTDISDWWKGLGKELEIDIENLEESENRL